MSQLIRRSCAVKGCKNSGRVVIKDPDVTYHCIPKATDMRRKWLKACNRKECGVFTRICSDHFDASDYERDLKAELLNLKPKKVLKPDAIPCRNIPGRVDNRNSTPRAARSKRRENKRLVEDLLASCETILTVGDKGFTPKNIVVSIT